MTTPSSQTHHSISFSENLSTHFCLSSSSSLSEMPKITREKKLGPKRKRSRTFRALEKAQREEIRGQWGNDPEKKKSCPISKNDISGRESLMPDRQCMIITIILLKKEKKEN